VTQLIDGSTLTVETLVALAEDSLTEIRISATALERMSRSREILDRRVEQGATIYGVNTNMGGMVKWLIPPEKAEAVQQSLIFAVATNVGPNLEPAIVRAGMLARINALAKGNSAISAQAFQALVALYNRNVIPCVPALGSLGTSGDLGPLAAVALVVTGRGTALLEGKVVSGSEALAHAGLQPTKLNYKDGLALINGTSFMVAMLSFALRDARSLISNYLPISALTFGALGAKSKPISPVVHALKQHTGQALIAERLHRILEEMPGVQSEQGISEKLSMQRRDGAIEGTDAVEDSYVVRCTPQILGPVLEAIDSGFDCLNREINSASDNPLIDLESQDIYHCGHFHGQYVAMASDHLKLAMSILANIADRRIDRLLDRKKNASLPSFLAVSDAGIRLGLMGVQFLSSSLASELRSNATPVSNQSLPSTGDFQDVVSLGFVAARQAREAVDKCAYVLGCELFLGSQAVDLLGYSSLPIEVHQLMGRLRDKFPFRDADRELTPELEHARFVTLSMPFEKLAL